MCNISSTDQVKRLTEWHYLPCNRCLLTAKKIKYVHVEETMCFGVSSIKFAARKRANHVPIWREIQDVSPFVGSGILCWIRLTPTKWGILCWIRLTPTKWPINAADQPTWTVRNANYVISYCYLRKKSRLPFGSNLCIKHTIQLQMNPD
jgi:hypothetical protein